jgi:hypothetical protein
MLPDLLGIVLQSAIGGVVAGVAFWATVKTEIKYLRRDVDLAHSFIRQHERDYHHG